MDLLLSDDLDVQKAAPLSLVNANNNGKGLESQLFDVCV